MIDLRRSLPEDAAEIARLHMWSRQVAMPWLPELHTLDETVSWVSHTVLPLQDVWVAVNDGTIVGMAACHEDMLEHLYVLPGHQGLGIGSMLLSNALAICEGPLRLWVFQRNRRAREFYEARGFKAILFTDGRDNEEREPDVLYEYADDNGVNQ